MNQSQHFGDDFTPKDVKPVLHGCSTDVPDKPLRNATTAAPVCGDRKRAKNVKKSTKKARCSHHGCRKKLRLTDIECRCEKRFCSGHRLPEQHSCDINYKTYDKGDFISKSGLGGGVPSKFTKI